MTMLPAELIEKILYKRSVYVSVKCYYHGKSAILGVFNDYENAFTCIMKQISKNTTFTKCFEDYYNPWYRFRRVNTYGGKITSCYDKWKKDVILEPYKIEEWCPDNNCISIKWLGLDASIKNYIHQLKPSNNEVKLLLKDWQDTIQHGKVPQELDNVMIESKNNMEEPFECRYTKDLELSEEEIMITYNKMDKTHIH